VAIDSGEGKIFTLKGRQTARQVMDAILRSERGDPIMRVYTAEDAREPIDCSKCPRQGFCGTSAPNPGAYQQSRGSSKTSTDIVIPPCHSLWPVHVYHSGA
jgi:hypothetical protein